MEEWNTGDVIDEQAVEQLMNVAQEMGAGVATVRVYEAEELSSLNLHNTHRYACFSNAEVDVDRVGEETDFCFQRRNRAEPVEGGAGISSPSSHGVRSIKDTLHRLLNNPYIVPMPTAASSLEEVAARQFSCLKRIKAGMTPSAICTMFDLHRREGVPPSIACYHEWMRTLAASGRHDQVRERLDEMVLDGYAPTAATHQLALKLLLEGGLPHEALCAALDATTGSVSDETNVLRLGVSMWKEVLLAVLNAGGAAAAAAAEVDVCYLLMAVQQCLEEEASTAADELGGFGFAAGSSPSSSSSKGARSDTLGTLPLALHLQVGHRALASKDAGVAFQHFSTLVAPHPTVAAVSSDAVATTTSSSTAVPEGELRALAAYCNGLLTLIAAGGGGGGSRSSSLTAVEYDVVAERLQTVFGFTQSTRLGKAAAPIPVTPSTFAAILSFNALHCPTARRGENLKWHSLQLQQQLQLRPAGGQSPASAAPTPQAVVCAVELALSVAEASPAPATCNPFEALLPPSTATEDKKDVQLRGLLSLPLSKHFYAVFQQNSSQLRASMLSAATSPSSTVGGRNPTVLFTALMQCCRCCGDLPTAVQVLADAVAMYQSVSDRLAGDAGGKAPWEVLVCDLAASVCQLCPRGDLLECTRRLHGTTDEKKLQELVTHCLSVVSKVQPTVLKCLFAVGGPQSLASGSAALGDTVQRVEKSIFWSGTGKGIHATTAAPRWNFPAAPEQGGSGKQLVDQLISSAATADTAQNPNSAADFYISVGDATLLQALGDTASSGPDGASSAATGVLNMMRRYDTGAGAALVLPFESLVCLTSGVGWSGGSVPKKERRQALDLAATWLRRQRWFHVLPMTFSVEAALTGAVPSTLSATFMSATPPSPMWVPCAIVTALKKHHKKVVLLTGPDPTLKGIATAEPLSLKPVLTITELLSRLQR